MSRRYFEKKTQIIFKELKLLKSTLGITFVTDREIAVLKGRYLGKKKPTDVLSFGYLKDSFPFPFPFSPSPRGRGIKGEGLGDIVISIDTVKKQAQELKIPMRERIVFLIIHGILHLLGYDHIKDKDWKVMKKKEAELWRRV